MFHGRYPHIMWEHCTAHALDLALEDWGKLPLFKELCRGVRDIVKFINGHQHSRAAFQARSDLRLLTPGEYTCSFLAFSQSTVHLGVHSSSARLGSSQRIGLQGTRASTLSTLPSPEP